MDSMAIIGDKTKHKNIPNEDGSNLCVCCKRYNLHYSKKYNINASNRDAYVAAFNFEVPIGVCCNSCYNKQYRFNKNQNGNSHHSNGCGGDNENNQTENSEVKPKRKRNSRKLSLASSSSASSSKEEDETLRIDEEETSSNNSLKRSSNCSSSDQEVSSSKKRKRSLTSLVTTTNTTTTVDQNNPVDQLQNSQNDLLTPWNALSNQDDEFLNLLESIPTDNNYVKSNNQVETLLPQIPHQPTTAYSLQSLLNEMANTIPNNNNIHNSSTPQYSNMILYNQFNNNNTNNLNTATVSSTASSPSKSFVDMVLGQDTTTKMLNSLDINELAMKRMKATTSNGHNQQQDHHPLMGIPNVQLASASNSNNEMVQPFCILDQSNNSNSNITSNITSNNNTTTPNIMTSNLSTSAAAAQFYNTSPSSAPFLSQLFSLPSSNSHQQYPVVTPQFSPNGTAQAAMFVIFFDETKILTVADYSHYENSLMTSKFSIHKCCTFSFLCEQLSEKMVNEKKLWNNNMLKSITQIKLKRNGVLTPIDPYTTPQLQFEHGDVLLVHLV